MTDPFVKVAVSRRKFVKQLATGAFTAPTLLSFPPQQAAGQAVSPTPTQSVSPTPTTTISPTPTSTVSPTPTLRPSPTPTLSISPTPTLRPSPTPTLSLSPTPTSRITPTPTPAPSSTPPPTPSASPAPGVVPFDDFVARGDVELPPGANNDRFTVHARFMLGGASDGIDPVHEDVTITLGPGHWTIPAGSFRVDRKGNSRRVRYTFSGMVGTTRLDVEITQRPDGSFQFTARGSHAELTGITNPAPFSLKIGNDAGTTMILLDADDESNEDDD
jgi:hypothetical protein